jgi:hypothetical protein
MTRRYVRASSEICTMDGCEKKHRARGLCLMHYWRWSQHGDPSIAERRTKHGRYRTPEYFAWDNMRQRCGNPKHPEYKNYGARGIKVCERWKLFINFFADMGERPSPELSLDRINNDGNYEPGNCRWATPKEQANNQRRTKLKEVA